MYFFEVIGRIAAVCGCITAIAAVILLIVSIVKRAKASSEHQDERIDALEIKLEEAGRRIDEHDQYFKNDLARFDKIESGTRVMQRAMLALLSHNIDGNDIELMKRAKQELQDYLIEQ